MVRLVEGFSFHSTAHSLGVLSLSSVVGTCGCPGLLKREVVNSGRLGGAEHRGHSWVIKGKCVGCGNTVSSPMLVVFKEANE